MSKDAAVGEVVNIGTEEEVTIEGLAGIVKQRTDSPSPIEYVAYDKAYEPGFEDMLRRVPSLEKLQQLISFRPSIRLPEIVDRVIDSFQSRVEESSTRDASRTSERALATGTVVR